ncbi:MAG: aquaporin [Vicinamibacterales bacterium]
MLVHLKRHWREYGYEALGLGVFMLVAAGVTTLLEHPESAMRQAIADPLARRLLMGLAMGATAMAIIYSPWGKRSGAHLNPAVTFTFWRLGKVEPWDAVFYVIAQFIGGLTGMVVAALALGRALAHPSVDFVVTRPGVDGVAVALMAEAVIAFVLMLTVLVMANRPGLNRFTGVAVGLLLVAYITFEAPLSGMSLNPARTVASAAPSGVWTGLWIYFVGPVAGMLAAVEAYIRPAGAHRVLCAKLQHDNRRRCIFRCSYSVETVTTPHG